MARKPLNVQEWLEDMLRFNGRDADRARELLSTMEELEGERDEAQQTAGQYEDIFGTVEHGKHCADDRRKAHEAFEGCELGVAFYSGPGNLGDAITRLLTYCGQLEAANNATRELAEAAGLIRHNDVSTDVVPLLRMFLPV